MVKVLENTAEKLSEKVVRKQTGQSAPLCISDESEELTGEGK